MELLFEGAEAKLYQINNEVIRKIRVQKSYRLESIDKKLRRARTRREFKVLTRLSENNVNAPIPINLNDKDMEIDMEFIKGETLIKIIDEELLKSAFEEIIKLHKLNIIHGDLTTMNMIVKENKVYIIDFGLADFSDRVEDKAVDLNLFFTCIKNEHPTLYHLKEELLRIYDSPEILKRLKNVESRGRNK